jgi:glycerol-3-phosphate dehydrogenase
MTTPQSPDKNLYDRNHFLKGDLAAQVWDVIVIGGGASGLGIALEAVTRGYKTILLEQADFAKGTSSRSTKLVHGGVRYLNQGDIKLVREATVERGILYRNAPHLVKNQQFIIPVYSHFDHWKYTMGLKLYDWISGRLSLGSSTGISRKETLQRIPGILSKNLVGGVVYHDGQFDDSRLAINLMQSICDNGGVTLNYMKVTGLLKKSSTISGVIAIDVETGTNFNLEAKTVINATGVFVDEILQMDNAERAKTICVSQGVHLVLNKEFYTSANALMIPKTSDGRVLFAVPWHDKVLLGTTDTPVDEPTLEPRALEKEIGFILSTAGNYLEKKPTRRDVLSVFAGLRPLAAPQGEAKKTKEISRSHKIVVSPSGLFTILGGKWTTYRKMGEDIVDALEKKLKWKHIASVTSLQHIHGYEANVDWKDPFYFYGKDAIDLKQLIEKEPNAWVSKKLGIHKMQVIWAVRNEMARTVEDVLSRRTRALLLDAAESIRMAHEVATIMATELKKDQDWIEAQVENFLQLARGYLLNDKASI